MFRLFMGAPRSSAGQGVAGLLRFSARRIGVVIEASGVEVDVFIKDVPVIGVDGLVGVFCGDFSRASSAALLNGCLTGRARVVRAAFRKIFVPGGRIPAQISLLFYNNEELINNIVSIISILRVNELRTWLTTARVWTESISPYDSS